MKPESGLEAFTCPFCEVYSKQKWFNFAGITAKGGIFSKQLTGTNLFGSHCEHCKGMTLWIGEELVYPIVEDTLTDKLIISLPNPDMLKDIQDDYMEAKSIVEKSPRGASALLRLCIQKLLIQVGEKGRIINEDIASLVEKGLPQDIQKALDIVRVIGNEAVHPGKLDLNDDKKIAIKLFELVNKIAYYLITQKEEINGLYEKLPESKRSAIEKRDKSTK